MNDALLGGRYRLLEPLGRGGMGVVYAAIQEGLGRRVAVKLLDPRLCEDRQQLERFRREAEVVAALGHPNIVQVTDFQYPDEAHKQPYIVMELLRGESLGACIARENALPFERVAFIAAQVLSALGAAHRTGVVHRDVKPDNVFLLSDAAIPDTVKVLDFGIAKLAATDQAKLTGTGAMLGTPAFMAPEQARGAEDVDERADLYAVGATMYQALSGRMPHEAPSIPALLFAIVEKTPTPLAQLRPDVPLELLAVIERAMAKNRADRFADAEAMRAALTPWSGLAKSSSANPPAVAATLATAPTIASYPPAAYQPTTPALTPVVPYAPPMPQPVQAAHASKKLRKRTMFLIVLGSLFWWRMMPTCSATSHQGEREHVAAHASAMPQAETIARTATSLGLNAAAQALASAAPTITASVASAAPSASASVAKVVARRRYSGAVAYAAGTDFSNCPQCDWESYRNDIAMKTAEMSKCFKASQYEPPLHEFVYYEVGVSETGALTSLAQAGSGPSVPRLDQCLFDILKHTPLRKPGGAAGSFKMGFKSECTPGWADHCD